jgi:hypothetical protein
VVHHMRPFGVLDDLALVEVWVAVANQVARDGFCGWSLAGTTAMRTIPCTSL